MAAAALIQPPHERNSTMAETQDLEVLIKENDAYAHTISQRTEMKVQLAQAEQTSRLADAVEGVLKALEAAMRPDSEQGDKRSLHFNNTT